MIHGNAMRALLVSAATLCLAGGVAACGGDDEDEGSGAKPAEGGNKAAKIALFLPESKTTRYDQQDKPNFERRLKEICSGCELIYHNADQDPAKQQQQAESAITAGAKVLVVDAVDVKSAAAIAQRAKQAKIPVVSYLRLIADADLDYYISIDPFKTGQQQAQALLDALKEKGVDKPRVIMINGAPTDSNAAPYKRGAHSVLEAAGAKIVKEFDTPDWSPDKAQQEMEQSITAAGKDGFDGVYVANDGMATGVIAAMKSANISREDRPVTGQDAEVAALQRILDGEQLMTIYQDIKKMAGAAADAAVALANGKAPPRATAQVDNGFEKVPSVLTTTIPIAKDDIADPIVKDGFYTVDEICTSQYKKACADAGLQ